MAGCDVNAVRNSPGWLSEVHVGHADGLQPLAGVFGAVDASAHLGGELVSRESRHLGQQCIAVGEMAVGRRVRHPGRPGGLAEDYPIGSALAGQCDARLDQGRVQRTVVVGLSAIGAVVVGAHVTHIGGSHANRDVDNGHIRLHTGNVTSGNFSWFAALIRYGKGNSDG